MSETTLVGHSRASLIDYVVAQIGHVVPDGRAGDCRTAVERHVDGALARTMACVNLVRMWKPGRFDLLHSSQHCIFLYLLANTIWRESRDSATCTRLFLVNKAFNGIDLFYEIDLVEPFFIGHSVGIVLAKASYGSHLVLYQNSTIGRSGSDVPVIGSHVVVYPNCAIIGRSRVADGTILSQGSSLINRDSPGDCIVYRGGDGKPAYRPAPADARSAYFRLPGEP
jgi:serine O-acetyltransferase